MNNTTRRISKLRKNTKIRAQRSEKSIRRNEAKALSISYTKMAPEELADTMRKTSKRWGPKAEWRFHLATQKQLEFLARMDYIPQAALTAGQASDLIDKVITTRSA